MRKEDEGSILLREKEMRRWMGRRELWKLKKMGETTLLRLLQGWAQEEEVDLTKE